MERNFRALLSVRWAQGLFVCIGLDPVLERIPRFRGQHQSTAGMIAQFNRQIVKATHHLVCAYKPNSAFYERYGEAGLAALRMTIRQIRAIAPEVPVILDIKRGDIGSSNLGYIEAAFDYFRADAVTVHPYLGMEAMKPFLDQKDKGVIVLCRTSNPGAGEFQDLEVDIGEQLAAEWGLARRRVAAGTDVELATWPRLPFYQVVAHRVTRSWNYNDNCGLVVGATYPGELEVVRKIAPRLPFLIPGVGTQGGDLEAAVRAGADSEGRGMIINSSSALIFAYEKRDDLAAKDFAEAARDVAQQMHDQITAALRGSEREE